MHGNKWWAIQDSNLWPSACKAAALPLRQSPVKTRCIFSHLFVMCNAHLQDSQSFSIAPCMSRTTYPPTDYTAVLSAMGSLTTEFGMGSGDPSLYGSAHARRWSNMLCINFYKVYACQGFKPLEGYIAHWVIWSNKLSINRWRARPISTARLKRLLALQLRPIKLLV